MILKNKKLYNDLKTFELKINLEYIKPQIWRRFALPCDTRLDKVHNVIQIVMGWEDYHLHQFVSKDKKIYGIPDPDGPPTINEKRAKLTDLVNEVGDEFLYEYDFGDGWLHRIKLVKIRQPNQDERAIVCLSGKRACPPEDVGGAWGYQEVIENLSLPKRKRDEELIDWLGDYDPEYFRLKEVNQDLEDFFG